MGSFGGDAIILWWRFAILCLGGQSMVYAVTLDKVCEPLQQRLQSIYPILPTINLS